MGWEAYPLTSCVFAKGSRDHTEIDGFLVDYVRLIF